MPNRVSQLHIRIPEASLEQARVSVALLQKAEDPAVMGLLEDASDLANAELVRWALTAGLHLAYEKYGRKRGGRRGG